MTLNYNEFSENLDKSGIEYCDETRTYLTNMHVRKYFINKGKFAGVCFISEWCFNLYCQTEIGYDDSEEERGGQWLFPINYLKRIGDIWDKNSLTLTETIEKCLNFKINHGMNICVRLGNLNEVKPLLPRRKTPGVNKDWIIGGFTKGGTPEIVVAKTQTKNYKIFNIGKDCSLLQFSRLVEEIEKLLVY